MMTQITEIKYKQSSQQSLVCVYFIIKFEIVECK